MTTRRANREGRFGIEGLETREVMAGDVTASLVNGNLTLREANFQGGLDNAVMISQLSNGKIRVTGNSTADGSVSRINGAAFQDFKVTGNLTVNFGGGNDLVVIQPESGGAVPAFGDVQINVGQPLPTSTTKIPDNVVFGQLYGPDRDDVIVWGLKTRGALSINTGDDNDWVFLAKTQVKTNLKVNTGAGADTFTMKSATNVDGDVSVQMYSNVAENSADVFWMESAGVKGNMKVLLGGGDDVFHMSNGHVLKTLNLDAGAGDDSAEFLAGAVADELFAKMGEGNDSLSVDGLYGRKFHFLGGAGSDSLTRTANVFGQVVEQTGWEVINGKLILTAEVPGQLASK